MSERTDEFATGTGRPPKHRLIHTSGPAGPGREWHNGECEGCDWKTYLGSAGGVAQSHKAHLRGVKTKEAKARAKEAKG